MRVLPFDKQVLVISLLVEGNGIRAVNRLTKVAVNTIMALGYRVGRGCAELHDQLMVGISPSRIEVDEIWTFVKKRPPRSFYGDDGNEFEEPNTGSRFTFMCLAAEERAIVSYWTGRRDARSAYELLSDLRCRLKSCPEFSSDGFIPFEGAIKQHFGNVDYGHVIKHHDIMVAKRNGRRFMGREISGCPVEKRIVAGSPRNISTGRIERLNLTMRMRSSRFRRGTSGFSKKLENHAAAVNLQVFHYNFVRAHKALKGTPAMMIGVADRPWKLEELVERALQEFCPTENFDPEMALIGDAS